jgi:hypothetical protein
MGIELRIGYFGVMPDVLPRDYKDDVFGDIGRVIRNAFQISRNED